jgi:hypothetical protein
MTMPGKINVAARMIASGPGAAAVLAAGIGSCALGIISFAADKARPIAKLLNVYAPAGPLSGVSTLAILVWLAAWGLLHYFWRDRNLDLRLIVGISFTLLAIGILLTFPPFADML